MGVFSDSPNTEFITNKNWIKLRLHKGCVVEAVLTSVNSLVKPGYKIKNNRLKKIQSK